MVVDVEVEVKGGVLQYPLREEDTMGRETEHETPRAEFQDLAVDPSPRETIGEHGLLGCIYEVVGGGFVHPILAQFCDSEDGVGVLIDPRDGITWICDGGVSEMVIVKRYNARLVLTEVK